MGSEINDQEKAKKYQEYLMMGVASSKLRHLVKSALDNGANPNLPDAWDDMPLNRACRIDGGEEMVKLLLDYGADPRISYRNGENALTVATSYGKM